MVLCQHFYGGTEENKNLRQYNQASQLGLELGISHYKSEMLLFDLTFMSSTQYLSVT